jgi:hypothetical protein
VWISVKGASISTPWLRDFRKYIAAVVPSNIVSGKLEMFLGKHGRLTALAGSCPQWCISQAAPAVGDSNFFKECCKPRQQARAVEYQHTQTHCVVGPYLVRVSCQQYCNVEPSAQSFGCFTYCVVRYGLGTMQQGNLPCVACTAGCCFRLQRTGVMN